MANKIQQATNQMQAQKKADGPRNLQDYIRMQKSGIAAALPSVMTPERFTRIALSAVSSNPKLGKCEPTSFLAAMMTCAQLGLEPNTPLQQSFLIPRCVRGEWKCVFEIGYQGVLDLAWRSGLISDIQCETVYENDFWEYELGLNRKLRHVPADKDRGDPVRYYAVVRTTSGGVLTAVWSREDVVKFAEVKCDSYGNDKSAWHTDFDAMAKKTVLKQALKYAPKSSEFAKQLALDGTAHDQFEKDMADVPCVDLTDDEPLEGEVVDPSAVIDAPADGQATMEGM